MKVQLYENKQGANWVEHTENNGKKTTYYLSQNEGMLAGLLIYTHHTIKKLIKKKRYETTYTPQYVDRASDKLARTLNGKVGFYTNKKGMGYIELTTNKGKKTTYWLSANENLMVGLILGLQSEINEFMRQKSTKKNENPRAKV